MAENRTPRLKKNPVLSGVRVGIGFDAHPLKKGRRLILGGVEVPFEQGLDGHSDADVLVHAVIDAILGAAGRSDIGRHYPPGDPATLGISSLVLLKRVHEEVARKGYRLLQVDSVIIAERPRLAPYVDSMRSRIAQTVHLRDEDVNVKAKTTEGMGFAGRGEGIAAQAVVLLAVKGRRGAKRRV
jgi:2-C-methyl-D-erythritol 2,4-cyclodiphosphate synthase